MSDERATAARVSDPGIRALYRLENRWQAWLDVEVALAKAQAELGIIPPEAARRSPRAARLRAARSRTHRRGLRANRPHDRPLVWELVAHRRRAAWRLGPLGRDDAEHHPDRRPAGAARRRIGIFLRLIGDALAAAADLAERGADMPIAGRTHGQHAVPATFGYKVAVWIDELLRHVERLRQAAPRHLCRDARRRRRHLCLARRAGAGGAGRHRPAISACGR